MTTTTKRPTYLFAYIDHKTNKIKSPQIHVNGASWPPTAHPSVPNTSQRVCVPGPGPDLSVCGRAGRDGQVNDMRVAACAVYWRVRPSAGRWPSVCGSCAGSVRLRARGPGGAGERHGPSIGGSVPLRGHVLGAAWGAAAWISHAGRIGVRATCASSGPSCRHEDP